jgi:hypothetical protein
MMRRQHAVVARQVDPRTRHQGGEARDKVDGFEHDLRGAVAVGSLERVDDPAVCTQGQALNGDRRASDIAAQALTLIVLMGLATDAGM